MSAPVFRVDSIADALRLIAFLSQNGCSYRIPLIQAVIERRICHQEFNRSSPSRAVKLFLAATRGHSTVALLGDDDDSPTGPAGYPCAKRLIAWARLVVLHGTGGERHHYEGAVEAAQLVSRVLFVETTSARLPDWIAAVAEASSQPAVQIIRPTPGQAHPAPKASPQVTQ